MPTWTIFLALAVLCSPAAPGQSTFTNPLLPSGADPYVIRHGGFYYYTNTTGSNLTLWKTADITALATATRRVVWTPPAGQTYSQHLWAPELHFLNKRWYLYFAADDGLNQNHRIWVLENSSADPLEGTWTLKGKLADPGDHWAIDPTVFENRAHLYLVWAGWPGFVDGQQNIYIAELLNPWTIQGDRALLSSPQYEWERAGDTKVKIDESDNPGSRTHQPIHVDVNEAPEILKHGHELFLIYSASGCWTDWYELGMLSARDDADVLDAASWKKNPLPVFWQSPSAHAFGTGHNSFFQSPDGQQDWIIYHANPESGQGCGGQRSPRAQPFHWNSDGTPDFGRPVSVGQPIPRP